MRGAVLLLLAAAACSEAPPPQPEDTAAAKLSAGQWELTREVTKLTNMDEGVAAVPAKVGDKTSLSVCLDAADAADPPPELLTGMEEADCKPDSLYLSGGRVNGTYSCQPKDVDGKMSVSTAGSFTPDSLALTTTGSTLIVGTGDVRIEHKLTGRRTGECTAAAPPAKT